MLGAVILVAVIGYFGFQGLDSYDLSKQTGAAVVTGKEHMASKKTYRTDYIGGRPQVIPQFTPDMYVIRLRIGNTDASAAVDRELFEAMNNGDQLAVTYQRTRFTGRLQVASVHREVR
jgi:hypothetical protein